MKSSALIVALLLAISGPLAFAADEGTEGAEGDGSFYQGKQGEAKDALEKTAGKTADEVEVPAVPPPTPAE